MSDLPRLLLVTDRNQIEDRPLEQVVALCVEAGFRHVLLRERDLPREAYDDQLARIVDEIGSAATVITREPTAGTVGCHLAACPMIPSTRPAIVGRSVHDMAGVRRAVDEGVDYVLAGPFAPTASKPGYGPILGLAGIEALLAVTGCPPLLAIGGIRPDHLATLAAVGAHGVAVMGPLMCAADPLSLAREYVAATAACWLDREDKECIERTGNSADFGANCVSSR